MTRLCSSGGGTYVLNMAADEAVKKVAEDARRRLERHSSARLGGTDRLSRAFARAIYQEKTP